MLMSLTQRVSSLFSAQINRLSDRRHTLRSVFAVTGGNFFSAVLGALGGLLVARFLGPEETGLFRYYSIPLLYITYLHLGTFDGLQREIPYYVGLGKADEVERIASASGAWNLLVTLIVTLGFALYALWCFINHDNYGAAGWLAQAFVSWSYFYGGYLGATYRTINHFVVYAKVQLIQSVAAFMLILAVPYFGFYGLCLRTAIPAIILVYLFHRFRPLKINLKLDIKPLIKVIKIGLPFCFWGTLGSSLWFALENSLLLKIGGVRELGLFSVVFVLREGLCVLTRAIQMVSAPRVIESYAREGSIRPAARKNIKIALALVTVMLMGIPLLSLCLDYFVPLAIPKYVEGLAAMKVALWAVVVEAASLPLNSLLATGKAWLYGRGVLAGLITFVIITPFLSTHVDALLAVVLGSLAGRLVRMAACYSDLYFLVRREMARA
jgi:O-antigen/teichoic acid export membrane protein